MSLHEQETYEAVITDDVEKGEWIAMAENLNHKKLPEYLEPVHEHELNRMEAELLENQELSDYYYKEMYGGFNE